MKYTLTVISLMLFASMATAQDRVKIGFIDVQRAINESQPGRIARDKFQAQVKKAETELLREKQELERLKSDFDKKSPLLKDDERRSMEGDLQKRVVNYQRAMGDLQQELKQKEGEMTGDILRDLEKIVTEVGKADKFTIILERSQILYSDQATDITSKVIEVYNSRSRSK